MKTTKVKDLMTDHPFLIAPETTLQKAAEMMKKVNCGFLPVGTKSKLLGVITDRDIIIRAIAEGKDPDDEAVESYMTPAVYSCNENDYLEDAAEKMQEHKVTRLVVKNAKGRVTGILSFGALLRRDVGPREAAKVVDHLLGSKVI